MSNWDDLDAELGGIDLGREAGEWAVTAMACVAYADGTADSRELEKARELVSRVSVIKNSLGPEIGERRFLETIGRLQNAQDDREMELLREELKDLATLIKSQEHRDHAFHTLVAISTADHEITASEYRMMEELKAIIGSTLMVPMPQVSV